MSALLVFEGIYSAGKSSQKELLVQRLLADGYSVEETEWNSSEILADHMLELRIAGRLSPRVLFLLELADFTDRYERVIAPALEAGSVVVADRYIETGIARGVVRGLDPAWCRRSYEFAARPSATVLFDCPPEVTLDRRRATGRSMAGYVSGEDFLKAPASRDAKFVHYQTLLRCEYTQALTDAMVIDSTRSREDIHDDIVSFCQILLGKEKSGRVL